MERKELMMIPTVVTKSAYEALLAKACTALTSLAREEEALLERTTAIQAELGMLQSRADARTLELTTAQQTVNDLRTDYQGQVTRVELTEGTHLHQEAKA